MCLRHTRHHAVDSQHHGILSKQSDIFAFGMVLLDMVTEAAPPSAGSEPSPQADTPSPGTSRAQAVTVPQTLVASTSNTHGASRQRLALPASCGPASCGPAYLALAEECVRDEPRERPTVGEVLPRLRDLLAEEAPPPVISLSLRHQPQVFFHRRPPTVSGPALIKCCYFHQQAAAFLLDYVLPTSSECCIDCR